MYNKNFVIAIKVDGKILREVEDLVYLPFGSEYTILLKNTSTLKVKAKISIDGTDVTEDVHLVIYPNKSTELKRFIRKGGHLNAGNAFKFIEKTAQIETYRGNKAEDGLITVEYEFEKPYVTPRWSYSHNHNNGIMGSDQHAFYTNTLCSQVCKNLSGGNLSYTTTTATANSAKLYPAEVKTSANVLRSIISVAKNEAGITAPGQVVNQKFDTAAWFDTDGVKHSMTLQLKGKTETAKVVKQAVIVKKVQRCTMCGNNTKQTAKFCHQCGASVEII